ncbi:MAG: hypothetical protein DSY33_05340 [Archaeoglobus sp.]|nr:MAG: hypothetical protein DSY33_05340 [Archaeoglobus sp.]
MHLCEGRSFVIVVSRILRYDGCKSENKGDITLFEGILNNFKKNHELKFEDRTGALFEVQYSMVSSDSKGFLLICLNQYGIPFIFVAQDLMYPFYRVEIIEEDVRKTKNHVIKLLRDSILKEFKDTCEINNLQPEVLGCSSFTGFTWINSRKVGQTSIQIHVAILYRKSFKNKGV